MISERKYPPDFTQFLKVLQKSKPDRPVLFEFFMNDRIYELLSGIPIHSGLDPGQRIRVSIQAFYQAGYDYVTIPTWFFKGMEFTTAEHEKKNSVSQNEGFLITNRASFETYPWPNPHAGDYDVFNRHVPDLPEGMKFIACCPGGVLENVINLTGFERLCYMMFEDEDLVQDIFHAVGSRLLAYYENIVPIDSIGALIVNDDWGFKTQTMLDTDSMRKLVFPWHKKIVECIHKAGKPAILHSCGNLSEVMDDVINDLKYDGKHSFEDGITPVEEAYEKWGHRIAILGGIDMDFLARSEPSKIQARASALINKTHCKSYALGSGNSIPEFIPVENYLAMIQCMHL